MSKHYLLVAVASVVAIWLCVLWLWDDAIWAMTYDDAWYYLGIARNLAAGHGSTFDRLNPTNGYHPLWLVVCITPFLAGLDDLVAARALLTLQLILYGTSLYLLSSLIAGSDDGSIGELPAHDHGRRSISTPRTGGLTLGVILVLTAGNPAVLRVFVNGMESGLTVLLDSLLLYFALRGQRRWLGGTTRTWRLVMGCLLALSFLGRIDRVLMMACLGAWWTGECLIGRNLRVMALIELTCPAAAVAAVYSGWNWIHFGSPIPVSGLVKGAPLTVPRVFAFMLFLAVAGWVCVWALRRNHNGMVQSTPFRRTVSTLARTGWYASFCIVLIGYYQCLQVQQWLWYYAPVILYLVLLLLTAVADLIELQRRQAIEKYQGRASSPWLLRITLVAPLFLALSLAGGGVLNPESRSVQLADFDAAIWIRRHLPEEVVLASWDAGVIGYFSHRRVINLDGVVNSIGYLHAVRQGSETVARFLTERGLGYIVNHGGEIRGEVSQIGAFIREYFGEEAAQRATVVFQRRFIYHGALIGSAGHGEIRRQHMATYVYDLKR